MRRTASSDRDRCASSPLIVRRVDEMMEPKWLQYGCMRERWSPPLQPPQSQSEIGTQRNLNLACVFNTQTHTHARIRFHKTSLSGVQAQGWCGKCPAHHNRVFFSPLGTISRPWLKLQLLPSCCPGETLPFSLVAPAMEAGWRVEAGWRTYQKQITNKRVLVFLNVRGWIHDFVFDFEPFNATSNSSNHSQASISRAAFKSRILTPKLSLRCDLPHLDILHPLQNAL